jgi:hypothetical protein
VVFRQAIEGDSFEGSRDVAVPLPAKAEGAGRMCPAHAVNASREQRPEIINLRGVISLCFGCALVSCAILQPHLKKGASMTGLLDLAVKAHGGLERWNKIKAIKVAASITGAIWYVKGKPDVLKNVVLTAETREERLTVDFPGQNKQARFEPNRVVIESANGGLIDARDNPEKSFEGQQRETPWDDIHVAYFVGEALWTYLNAPFLYTYEGFITEEVPSIQVENETWRRLKITFPESVKSHTKEQISCFGPDGLLRRHDYTVDILGGATGLNYAMDYRDVDGIIVPTKRRVYAYEGDYELVKEPLLVAIDMGDITLTYAEHRTRPEVSYAHQ